MDEIYRNRLDKQSFTPWNQLMDNVMYTALQSFVFHQESFAFRMMKMTIDNLIDTGIMRHLVDDYLHINKPQKTKDEPKVLTLYDLDLGFAVYLGFCGLSFIIFVIEIIWYKMNNKYRILFSF